MKSTGKPRTIYVHEEDYEYLRKIGGSYAEGLRRAVQAHRAAYAALEDELLESSALRARGVGSEGREYNAARSLATERRRKRTPVL